MSRVRVSADSLVPFHNNYSHKTSHKVNKFTLPGHSQNFALLLHFSFSLFHEKSPDKLDNLLNFDNTWVVALVYNW